MWTFDVFNRFILSVIHAEIKFVCGFIDPGGNKRSVHTPVVITTGQHDCSGSSLEYNTYTILLSHTAVGCPWVQVNCLMRPGWFYLEQAGLYCHSKILAGYLFHITSLAL